MKRLFDNEDRYSMESPPIQTLVTATLVTLIKDVAEAGYSMRDLELMIVREAGDICSQQILLRQLEQNKAKHPRLKFSRKKDEDQ